MQVGNMAVVTIDYTLTDPAGAVLDSSKGKQPLAYVHGTGGIIPGLEAALVGKQAGDAVQVTIAPEQAYGQHDPAMVQAVPRDRFPAQVEIKVGMKFQAQTPHGESVVRVVGVDAEEVRVDANHPLAGVTLHFDVAIVDVRIATPEELSHGHVHGPGGHHH